jgi:hypothetical protein
MIFLLHRVLWRDLLIGNYTLLHALEGPLLIGPCGRGGVVVSPHFIGYEHCRKSETALTLLGLWPMAKFSWSCGKPTIGRSNVLR